MNDHGIDLELRLVRYFTVVAEQLNFGRAAAELHLAQPALSRQVRRLENRLGVPLFDRTPRGVLLTDAGRAFLPEARALLRAAHRATLTARAHAPTGNVVVGYVEDLVVTPAVRELRRRHPQATIATRHLECHDEVVLAAGLVDVLVARAPLPHPADDVAVTVLYEEPRMLVLPADHHLAGRSSVSLRDFAGGVPVYCAHGAPRSIYPTDDGSSEAGPVVESFEDRIELVASGRAVAVVPVGDRRSSLRADLASVPIEDVPASEVVVVSRIGEANPLVADFVHAAKAHLAPVAA
ncbi:LysR family transcriptional regulator [Mycobacterium sp. NPDC006124]|uniref:LysR family transcriptional regulator n=1 Tax=Mycobacterium sp. NPDC006124 TaxID=3156729 RepID=UPI0033B8B272